jgi:hypothetical protein
LFEIINPGEFFKTLNPELRTPDCLILNGYGIESAAIEEFTAGGKKWTEN